MARTITQIYESMLSAKDSQSALVQLNSSSAYAIYKAFFYIASVAIHVHELLFDEHIKEVEYNKARSYSQTEMWWNDQCLNVFQYDATDTDKGVLRIDPVTLSYYYNTVDPTKRIIKFVATKQTPGSRQVNIKVSKDAGDGTPAQLTIDELSAVSTFVDRKQSAGLFLNVISFPADQIRLNLDISFDGQYILSNVKDNVKSAIKTYFRNLKFNGDIEIIKLIDAIQSVEGVTSAYLVKAEAKPDGSSYTEFTRDYSTKAGYASLNEVDSIFNMILQKN